MTNFNGRLGNRINHIKTLVGVAEVAPCNISIRKDMIQGYKARHAHFLFLGSDMTSTRNSTRNCPSMTGVEWAKYGAKHRLSPKHHIEVLRHYFDINSTHTLGKSCTSNRFAALHVRSGDMGRGVWNKTSGMYKPAGVNKGYAFYPTSFYTSVVREIRSRRGKDFTFIVFCEDMNNPTCDFFLKVSSTDDTVHVRVNQPLVDDLHIMLCAEEVAISRGSFQSALDLSSARLIKHIYFDREPQACKFEPSTSTQRIGYWISSANESASFAKDTKVWTNSGYQRYVINAFHEMEFCDM